MENKDRESTHDRKRPSESADDVCSSKEKDDHSGKKLKTDHQDRAKESPGKSKNVVVSASDSGKLKKQVGGGDQMMVDDEGKCKDPRVIIEDIFELDKSFEELISKLRDLVYARKRRHFNLPLRHVIQETEELDNIMNELKTEHDKTKDCVFASVLGAGAHGRGKDVVVSEESGQQLKKQVGAGDNITGPPMELESKAGQEMIDDQDISGVKELLEGKSAVVDVMKKLTEQSCSRKEKEDYEKMMNELRREHEKAMLILEGAGGSLEDVDSAKIDFNQPAETGTDQGKRQSDDQIGKTTTDKSGSPDELEEIKED